MLLGFFPPISERYTDEESLKREKSPTWDESLGSDSNVRFCACCLCLSESPHSEPGALDEVDNGPNTSDEGEFPRAAGFV